MEAAPHYLANRGNWQLEANQGGARAELDTVSTIKTYLDQKYPGEWKVVKHPTELKQLYFQYTYECDPSKYAKPANPTSDDVWYDPDTKSFLTRKGKANKLAPCGGCTPDCKIQNVATGKMQFLECKNQKAAGNAHERAAKFATSSVIAHVKKRFGMAYHPFGHLFTGGMVESRKYVLELQTTYGDTPEYLFLWKTGRPIEPLVNWLEQVILPPLRAE